MRKFKQDVVDYIATNYADNDTKMLADKLNCSISTVYRIAYSLGLHKSENKKASNRLYFTELLKKHGAKSRFAKGSVPANKGKKMPDTLKSQMAHTFFKKGNLPHNTRHDGAETIRVSNCTKLFVTRSAFV